MTATVLTPDTIATIEQLTNDGHTARQIATHLGIGERTVHKGRRIIGGPRLTRGTPREVLIDEVEHMLSFGDRPNRIAQALGIKPGSVAKALWRAGRSDLAVKFEQARRASESHPCIDCGDLVRSPAAPRCRPCGHRERSANLNRDLRW